MALGITPVQMRGPLSQQSLPKTFHDTHVNDLDEILKTFKVDIVYGLIEKAFHVACVTMKWMT